MGRVWVDRKDEPTISIVVGGDFSFILGCAEDNGDKAVLKVLVENCRGKIIVTDDILLISKLEKFYPDNFKRFSRYAIKREPNVFNKEHLGEFIKAVEPEFYVTRIDESIYYKLLEEDWTTDFCSNFSSIEEYLKHGIGYVIIQDGQIISGAGSYSYCRGSIEVTIETRKEYRRRGLALACASKVILECLERNIYLRWDAANLNSIALAEKLGYHFDKEYVVYSI